MKQPAILEAEGLKQSRALKAEGFALALQTIFNVARQLDGNTMLLQYLEALKALGASLSTKDIFPMEFTLLMEPLASMRKGNGHREPNQRTIW